MEAKNGTINEEDYFKTAGGNLDPTMAADDEQTKIQADNDRVTLDHTMAEEDDISETQIEEDVLKIASELKDDVSKSQADDEGPKDNDSDIVVISETYAKTTSVAAADDEDVAGVKNISGKGNDVMEIDDDAVQITVEGHDDWGALEEGSIESDITRQIAIAVESVNDDDIPTEPQPKIKIVPNTYDFEDDCQKYRYSRVLILSPFLVDDWSNEVINKHLSICDSYYINALRKNGQTDIAGKLEVTFAKRGAAEAAKKEISEKMGESFVKYISASQNKVTVTLSRKRRIIVVTGIPPKLMTVDKLMALFPNCLTVIPGSTIITKDCGYAYVEYEDSKTAFNMRKILEKEPIYIGKWLLQFSLLERPPEDEPRRSKASVKPEPKLEPIDQELKDASKERQKAINAIRIANKKLSFLKDLQKKRPLNTTQTESVQNLQGEVDAAIEKKKDIEKKWPKVLEYELKMAKQVKERETNEKESKEKKSDESKSNTDKSRSSRHRSSSKPHDNLKRNSLSKDKKDSSKMSKDQGDTKKKAKIVLSLEEIRRNRDQSYRSSRGPPIDGGRERARPLNTKRTPKPTPYRRPTDSYRKIDNNTYNQPQPAGNMNNLNNEMLGASNPFMNNSFEVLNQMLSGMNNPFNAAVMAAGMNQFADPSTFNFNTNNMRNTNQPSMTNNMRNTNQPSMTNNMRNTNQLSMTNMRNTNQPSMTNMRNTNQHSMTNMRNTNQHSMTNNNANYSNMKNNSFYN